ncbi:phage tail tape measure protein [Halomonas alkaliantarctica]|nr:phage tail tape measure protein [Halomonas alkaliantarctica]
MAKDLNLSVTLSAINKATGPLKKIMQGSRGAGRAIRETRDQLRDLNGQQKKITAFRDMSRQSHATRRALMDKREELKQISEQLKSTEGPTRRLTQQQAKAQREADKLSQEYRQQRDQVRELSRNLPPAVQGTRGLTEHNEALARQIEATNRRLERQQDALKRLGQADVSGKFRNMTGEVRRFTRNVTLAGGIAAGSIFGLANSTATLGDDIAKTSAKIGIGAGELQELRYAAERSGLSTQKLDSSTERFVKRLGEARQGGGAAAKAYEQLGLDASKLAELTPAQSLRVVADELAKVENHSDRVALAAKFFGREGVAMINMLKDGSAGLNQYAQDARAVGYVLGDEAPGQAETFKDALLDAQSGLTGMKNTLGAELMPAVTELMREFSGWMRENRDQVKAFAREFGERLKDAVPVIIDLAQGVGNFARTLAGMVTTAAELAGGFDNLALILGGLFAAKMVVSVVAFGASLIKAGAALGTLAGTLPGLIGGIKALGLAFMATPLGWVIAGITAVAAGAIYLWRNWETIGPKFAALWDGIKAKAGAVWEWLKGLFDWSPRAALEGAWGGIASWFGELWAGIKATFDGGIGNITRALIDWSPLGLLWRSISTALEALGVELPDKFSGLGGMLIDGIISGITGKLGELRDSITGAAGSAVGWFKDKLGINSPSKVFADLGGHTMDGYQQGLAKNEAGPLKEIDAFTKRMRQAGAGLALGAATLAGPATADVGVSHTQRLELPDIPRLGVDVGQPEPGGLQFDNHPPMTAASGGNTHITIGDINVHAAPGMDEQALARLVGAEVQRALAEAERDRRAKKRSAFYDTD